MKDNSIYRLNQNSGYLLMRAAQTYRGAIAQALKPHDLTPTQFFIIMSVWFYEGQAMRPTQAQVADSAATDINVASQVIRRLCAQNILERAVKVDDSRAYVLSLTKEGRELARTSSASVQLCHAQLFGTIDEGALQSGLRQFLTKNNKE